MNVSDVNKSAQEEENAEAGKRCGGHSYHENVKG